MTQHDIKSGTTSEKIGAVYLVTPGGLTAKGGIGRMVDYIHRTWNVPGAPMVVVDSYGPGPKYLMPFYFLRCVLRVLVGAAAGKIGLLHIHMSERLSVVRKGILVYLGKAFGIPVVLHLHGADFADYCRSLPATRLEKVRKMVGKADAVVTLGKFWHDFVRDELHVDPQRITILHNAVPGPEAVTERSNTTCRFLFLGVVCERKGVPTLLSALAEPCMAQLDWTLDLAGNGEVEFYKSEAIRLGIAHRVRFLGWIDEQGAKRLLEQSDVLVLPSRNEGLPMAILEAMAYGLPIVSTPVGSIADAVVHSDNGFLTPVGDGRSLATALSSLAADTSLRRAMGARARQRYLDMFNITAFNIRLAEIFRRSKKRLPVSTIDVVSGAKEARVHGSGIVSG